MVEYNLILKTCKISKKLNYMLKLFFILVYLRFKVRILNLTEFIQLKYITYSLSYHRSTKLGCKYIKIRKLEIKVISSFLRNIEYMFIGINSGYLTCLIVGHT